MEQNGEESGDSTASDSAFPLNVFGWAAIGYHSKDQFKKMLKIGEQKREKKIWVLDYRVELLNQLTLGASYI